jgi:membrane protein required for colicin V production
MNNWIDISLALVIILSVFSGVRMGFVRTAIGFAATVLGLIFALQYYRAVAVTLHHYISQPGVANIVGFAIVFFGVTIVGAMITGMLARFIHSLDLVWLDRLLGGAFGLVRGLLFGTLLIWAMMAFLPVQPKLVLSQSRLAPCVMDAARRVAEASPDEVKRTFRQSYRELNRVLPESIKDKLTNVPPTSQI